MFLPGPTYTYCTFSVYWTKSAVGLKLKNVKEDSGKQVPELNHRMCRVVCLFSLLTEPRNPLRKVIYLANPKVSMKDHLDFAVTCAALSSNSFCV